MPEINNFVLRRFYLNHFLIISSLPSVLMLINLQVQDIKIGLAKIKIAKNVVIWSGMNPLFPSWFALF